MAETAPQVEPPAEILLQARELRAGYTPEVDIVRGCAIDLYEGELVSVIGPNGAGKSTLIKSLFGLVPVRAGTVRFRGEEVTGASTHRLVEAGIGYVPQTENIFPTLTVEENLEMGAYLRPRAIKSRYEELSEWFPILSERRRQKAGTMSGGQRQLVALARALMLEPSLLLLDEPSAGLSPANVDAIFDRIKLINSKGVAILMVEGKRPPRAGHERPGLRPRDGPEPVLRSGTETTPRSQGHRPVPGRSGVERELTLHRATKTAGIAEPRVV